MTFISYAQNGEDVLLWRCFNTIDKGFYIDLGAAWPQLDSVTHAFYQRGWCGINIEPNPKLQVELKKNRPNDVNLDCAIGRERTDIEMVFFGNMGLSTAVPEIAATHIDRGEKPEPKRVSCQTLADICEAHVPQHQPIHFLKVDVEGMERDAFLGADFSRFRPQVILVESTLPMSQTPCWSEWEPLLTAANYDFVYFDGLNRYYVAQERAELKQHFQIPLNLWDDYKKAEWLEQEHIIAQLKQAQTNHQTTSRTIQQLENELAQVYSSRSWRLTQPLRQLANLLKLQKEGK